MKRTKIEPLDPTTRAYLKQMLADYPNIKSGLEADRRAIMPSSTPNYNATPVSSGGESRPVEGLTMRMMSEESFVIREWKINAIESMLAKIGSIDKKIIELCFWTNPRCSYEKAGQKLGYSPVTILYHINNIIDLLAYYYGEGIPR